MNGIIQGEFEGELKKRQKNYSFSRTCQNLRKTEHLLHHYRTITPIR